MRILGIETSTATCATALWQQGHLNGEVRFKRKRIHAESLADMVSQVLAQGEASFAELDGIAVSIGPGSFTGLRIGLAMAKGIAFSHNIAVVGIHTPDAIASMIVPDEAEMIVAMPSRKGEVYAARYKNLDGAYHRDTAVEAVTVSEFSSWSQGVRLIAGPGMYALMNAGLTDLSYLPERFWEMSAAPVARLGSRKLLAEGPDDLSALEPDYVKAFHTTMRVGDAPGS